MRRTILLSLVVMGAALSVVFGAGTFAPFTDTTTGTGTVSAGTVDVVLASDTDDVVDLNLSKTTCAEPLAGGETCTFLFTIVNAGSLSAVYAVTLTEVEVQAVGATPGDCYTVTYSPTEAVVEAGNAGDDNDHDPAESIPVTATVTLDDDANVNDCQGASVTITYKVDATQSASPRN